jgi:flagellar biogenesis protein FliO
MNFSIVALRKWWDKSSKQQRTLAVLFLIGLLATGMLLMVSGSPDSQDGTIGSSLYYAGVMVKLVGILLLIVGGGIVLRRWQSKGGRGLGRQLGLVETVRLSPKQALHLVRVGDRHILVGATDQGIAMLTEVDLPEREPETVQAAPAQEMPIPVNFNAVLKTLSAAPLEVENGGSR